jgi:hypothetical protein
MPSSGGHAASHTPTGGARSWPTPAGTGFWHETYFARGGIESVYLDMPPNGFTSFAPAVEARRSLFSARRRLRPAGDGDAAPAVSEQEFYE